MARYINCAIECDDCKLTSNARIEIGSDVTIGVDELVSVMQTEYPKGWKENREYGYGYSEGRDVLHCPECAIRHKKGSW